MPEQHDLSAIQQACDQLASQGRAEELLQWADRALAQKPGDLGFTSFRSLALNLLGRHREAAGLWAHDAPTAQEDAALNRLRMGYSLMMACDYTQAIAVLNEARQMAAGAGQGVQRMVHVEAMHYLGEAMLKAGDPRGFTYWLMRNENPHSAACYDPEDIPTWQGETQKELRGRRVLITNQLGFGDNFLLHACMRDWLDAGAQVMFLCDLQIHALMQASFPQCEVLAAPRPSQYHGPLPQELQARVQEFAPQLHGTLLHLPLLRVASAAPGYHFTPYIHASHDKQQVAAQWASALRAQHPGKKLVGVFWDCCHHHLPGTSSTMHWWAKRRSLPLDAVSEFVTDAAIAQHVHFVNLHHPIIEKYIGAPADNLSRYTPGIWDFDDTAACTGQLDAVLAVDSAVANLAAMMDVPVCVPVNTSSDWRWGCCGTASPWLDNVMVLHQAREGDWTPVVQGITAWLMGLPHRWADK